MNAVKALAYRQALQALAMHEDDSCTAGLGKDSCFAVDLMRPTNVARQNETCSRLAALQFKLIDSTHISLSDHKAALRY